MTAEWLVALSEACERSSQSAVARRLGVSATLVNQVLKGVYKGDMRRVQRICEGVLLNATVDCPALGELPRNKCEEHQDRPRKYAVANPLTVRMWRACRSGCPHSRHAKIY